MFSTSLPLLPPSAAGQSTDTHPLLQRFSARQVELVKRHPVHTPLNNLDYLVQITDDSVEIGIITKVQTSFHEPPSAFDL
jgi:hypothetical protein